MLRNDDPSRGYALAMHQTFQIPWRGCTEIGAIRWCIASRLLIDLCRCDAGTASGKRHALAWKMGESLRAAALPLVISRAFRPIVAE